MRIPFDLIAAVLLLDGVGRYLESLRAPPPEISGSTAALYWLAFLAITWLLNELAVRRVEWATRFGHRPSGLPNRTHPLVLLSWGTRIAHGLTVALFAYVVYRLQWPLYTQYWPEWLGLSPESAVIRLPQWLAGSPDAGLALYNSNLAAVVLDLGPFLLAMLVGWIPRRRLASNMRRRPIPLFSFLMHEIKLTWLPLILWVALAAVADASALLPSGTTAWMSTPGMDLLLLLFFIGVLTIVILPVFVVWWWECSPLPDGELKTRMLGLMERSGVKARAILVWGSKNSGILNACVMGPWAPFRYVLISPSLVDELGMEETEAVLAHELGHARYGHLTLLFVMILCMSALLDPLSRILPYNSPLVQAAFMASFVILYIWLFFGAIMRRCEREADLASAELLGTPKPLVTALERLATISGNIRNVYCWHHGSIAQRVEAVQQLSVDPGGRLRLHKEVRRVRILFVALTVIAICAQLAQRLI